MDLRELATQALLVAIILAVARALLTRVPGPIGRLAGHL
jgi:hypothetical protein